MLRAWRDNPLLFVTEALDATPEPWQAEALDLIGKHDRVAIRSGHGVGKTTWLAWLVLWYLVTRFPTQIPVTANSQDQLRDVVWSAIRKWHRELSSTLRNEFDITAQRVMLKVEPEASFAVARTASKDTPEALQGFHADNLLFILEEASAIPEEVIEVAHGSLSTAGAKIVMVGNPTRGTGFFFDAFHKLRARWHLMHVNSEDVPRAQGHIEDIIARYGLDSNQYRVRVLGEFPIEDDDVLIPLHLIEAAVRRWKDGLVEQLTTHRGVWGVDVARFGDDRGALAKRCGNALLESVKWWRNKDTMQAAGIIKAEYESELEENRPFEILVDVIGIGAGVVDRLDELGLPVRGINVAERPSSDDQYSRLRDELGFKARAWFEARDCLMPDDAALIAELTDIRYDFASSGLEKLGIERKKDFKKRNPQMGSPDLADAFFLTFAGGIERIKDHVKDRYSRQPRRIDGGAWAG